MKVFKIDSVSGINGDGTLGEGAQYSDPTTNNFETEFGGGSEYTISVNGAGSRYNRIQNTNQAHSWSTSPNLSLSGFSGDDYDAFVRVNSQGNAGQNVNAVLQDRYNYDSNLSSKGIAID